MNKYAFEIDETSLGFQEYHPYKGYFMAEGKMLKHYLPAIMATILRLEQLVPYISSINEIFTDFDSFLKSK